MSHKRRDFKRLHPSRLILKRTAHPPYLNAATLIQSVSAQIVGIVDANEPHPHQFSVEDTGVVNEVLVREYYTSRLGSPHVVLQRVPVPFLHIMAIHRRDKERIGSGDLW